MRLRFLWTATLLLFFYYISLAQNTTDFSTKNSVQQMEVVPSQYDTHSSNPAYQEAVVDVDLPPFDDGPFVAFSLGWEYTSQGGHLHALEYYAQDHWEVLPFNHHIEKSSDRQKSELVFLPFEARQMRLRFITEGTPALSVKLHFYNPGHSPKKHEVTNPEQRSQVCPCPEPDYQTRSEWCPNGQCPPNPSPSTTNVQFLIVHHSAGTNQSNDWPAVVRAIWNFHVNTNGWSDIGYNWLVDPEGTLYEGRGKDILGAHFCGMNSGTMGVCMMGNYTNIQPPDTAVQTLTKMLAWNSCEENLDPLSIGTQSGSGLTLNRISGHRDGCATACPGDDFYPTLPDVREAVADYIDTQCTPLVIDMLVDTIFTNVEEIIAGEQMLLRCRITNNSTVALQNFAVNYQIDGETLYTKIVANLNSGASVNLLESHTFETAGDVEYCVEIESIDGEISTDNNQYCGPLSVQINTSTSDLSEAQIALFPNPSTGVFNLENPLAQRGQIQIFDTKGRALFSTSLSGDSPQQIDLSQQAKGLYFLQLSTGARTYYQKLIVR